MARPVKFNGGAKPTVKADGSFHYGANVGRGSKAVGKRQKFGSGKGKGGGGS